MKAQRSQQLLILLLCLVTAWQLNTSINLTTVDPATFASFLGSTSYRNSAVVAVADVATDAANATLDETPPNIRKRRVNILYGLSGNLTGFINEFEVSLKSVLLNAPLDAPLDIHVMVDSPARRAVEEVFAKNALIGSMWRNWIRVILYVVRDELKDSYMARMYKTVPVNDSEIAPRVGVGGLFRLFAHEVLLDGTDSVLYLDNEVIILANLNEINTIRDDTHMYQIGYKGDDCSGFMIINLNKIQKFHELLPQVDPGLFSKKFDDQLMLHNVKILVRNRNRERMSSNSTVAVTVGELPPEWHVHFAPSYLNGRAHLLRERRTQFGILHFNGVSSGNRKSWWDGGGTWKLCNNSQCRANATMQDAFRQTWNLAEYYIHIPFEEVKYLGRSLVGADGGHPLSVITRCPASDPHCLL